MTHYFIMKIQNKLNLKKIAINQLSDIEFNDFLNFCEKICCETTLSLVNGTIFTSTNFLHFWGDLIEGYKKVIMTTNEKNRDEKVQCDTNKEAGKVSALSSGKVDKYEYLTGEETLPSNQSQIKQQAKFTFYPWFKALEAEIKRIKEKRETQITAHMNKKRTCNWI